MSFPKYCARYANVLSTTLRGPSLSGVVQVFAVKMERKSLQLRLIVKIWGWFTIHKHGDASLSRVCRRNSNLICGLSTGERKECWQMMGCRNLFGRFTSYVWEFIQNPTKTKTMKKAQNSELWNKHDHEMLHYYRQSEISREILQWNWPNFAFVAKFIKYRQTL